MTDETGKSEATHEPRECMPCGGSGQVISNLGGSPAKVTCPWCGGDGVRRAGTDAQAAWAGQEQPAGALDGQELA